MAVNGASKIEGAQRIENDFDTVTGPPSKGEIDTPRKARAMHPPVGVPAKGGPLISAEVTRPEGAKVTLTRAVPEGSSGARHPDAAPAAELRALLASLLLNSRPLGAGGWVAVGVAAGAAAVAAGGAVGAGLAVFAGVPAAVASGFGVVAAAEGVFAGSTAAAVVAGAGVPGSTAATVATGATVGAGTAVVATGGVATGASTAVAAGVVGTVGAGSVGRSST